MDDGVAPNTIACLLGRAIVLALGIRRELSIWQVIVIITVTRRLQRPLVGLPAPHIVLSASRDRPFFRAYGHYTTNKSRPNCSERLMCHCVPVVTTWAKHLHSTLPAPPAQAPHQ